MQALLTRRGVFEVVNGTETRLGGSNNHKKIRDFERKQQEAHAEIILNVTPPQLAHCRDANPKTIRDNLQNVHCSCGRSTVIALRRGFHRLRLEHSETMSAYVARVRHVAFLLEEADVLIADEDLITAITSGLPHSYDPFLVSLDATPDDDFTLTNVISCLTNKYQRQHMYTPIQRQPDSNNSTEEAMSVSSFSPNLSHITCFACRKKGHYQANCPTRSLTATTPVPTKPNEYAGIAGEEEDSDSECAF
ncbi:hypothetical protein CVT26_001759 [Gymnopilus dilepis]|uniref:CCHC-type domain-containing protein n=1 Tax=Gymnopilus dilepis TaxID=231916 RepID=A0A409WE64_9AGAR|nr:hypothetical protein CVT26_001759 [Gymnopilus dilepis]